MCRSRKAGCCALGNSATGSRYLGFHGSDSSKPPARSSFINTRGKIRGCLVPQFKGMGFAKPAAKAISWALERRSLAALMATSLAALEEPAIAEILLMSVAQKPLFHARATSSGSPALLALSYCAFSSCLIRSLRCFLLICLRAVAVSTGPGDAAELARAAPEGVVPLCAGG